MSMRTKQLREERNHSFSTCSKSHFYSCHFMFMPLSGSNKLSSTLQYSAIRFKKGDNVRAIRYYSFRLCAEMVGCAREHRHCGDFSPIFRKEFYTRSHFQRWITNLKPNNREKVFSCWNNITKSLGSVVCNQYRKFFFLPLFNWWHINWSAIQGGKFFHRRCCVVSTSFFVVLCFVSTNFQQQLKWRAWKTKESMVG